MLGRGVPRELEHGRRLRASQRAQGAQVRPLPGHPGGRSRPDRSPAEAACGATAPGLRWDTVTRLPAIIKVTKENVSTDLGILQVIPLARALVLNGEDNQMTTAELEGHPKSLSDGEQVLEPDGEANEAILQDFRQ